MPFASRQRSRGGGRFRRLPEDQSTTQNLIGTGNKQGQNHGPINALRTDARIGRFYWIAFHKSSLSSSKSARWRMKDGVRLERPFTRLERPFARLERPFARLERPFARLERPSLPWPPDRKR